MSDAAPEQPSRPPGWLSRFVPHRLGLRNRILLTFTLGVAVLAIVLAFTTYGLTRSTLLRQEEDSALDARARWWLRVMFRMKPGQTIEATASALHSQQPGIRATTIPQHWTPDMQARYLRPPLQPVEDPVLAHAAPGVEFQLGVLVAPLILRPWGEHLDDQLGWAVQLAVLLEYGVQPFSGEPHYVRRRVVVVREDHAGGRNHHPKAAAFVPRPQP